MNPPICHVNISWPHPKIRNGAKLAAIGSCFAEEIAAQLFAAGFPGASNPNGILYNAISMAEAVERAVDGPSYGEGDFFEFEGKFHSWLHHGAFSSPKREEAVAKAEEARSNFRKAVEECELFIATPSSSVVYEVLETGHVAANCHKVPGKQFNRRILSVEENLAALRRLRDAVRRATDAPIVFTLSPARHYPGDLVLNAQSKAQLLSALHACEGVRYFPAYEIVLDELRDYRFFKEDMLHPNALAVDYVLKAFLSTCFEDGALATLERAAKEAKAAGHIPLEKRRKTM